MLVDDYVMRQIRKIAELCAALVASGEPVAGLEEEIADAYRSLTGLPGEMIDRLDGASLARMARGPEAARALGDLLVADGDRMAHAGDVLGAARRFQTAVELLREIGADPALVQARLA